MWHKDRGDASSRTDAVEAGGIRKVVNELEELRRDCVVRFDPVFRFTPLLQSTGSCQLVMCIFRVSFLREHIIAPVTLSVFPTSYARTAIM